MRRLVLLAALCGCASAGTPEDTSSKPTAIFTSDQTGTHMGDAPRPTMSTVAAPPATVWAIAKKVYAEIDVPVTVDNPATHQLGNTNFYKMHQMAGKRMSDLVNCGMAIDGPKAATYRIYMSLITKIVDDGKGGTTLQTTLGASGRDIAGGAGSDQIQCGSSGILESLITEKITANVGR